MSEEGKTIKEIFNQTRGIFKDVSLLLRTVEEQMTKEEWEAPTTTATAGGSSAIQNPDAWLPYEVFRFFYNNEEHPNFLVFVSVLLDTPRKKEYEIDEPLITAGFFDFGKTKVEYNNFSWDYSKWYGLLYKEVKKKGENVEYGHIISRKYETQEQEEKKYPFQSVKCFAWPLTTIKNSADVESKITKQLIQLLQSV